MDEAVIRELLHRYETPQRVALSKRFPRLRAPIIATRRALTKTRNALNRDIRYTRSASFYPCVVTRHQSVLRRKLGESNPTLQERKAVNLKRACRDLNGVAIPPGKIFSLWEVLGKPTYRNGYVDGMLLSNGRVIEGIGGGLCQLSNFLFWLFLHAPIEIVERYHHSMDVFPDEGRTLPFGSGATILYNFVDLKIRNIALYPLQLKIWVTDNHLKGQLVCPERIAEKFSIYEQHHTLVKTRQRYFRFNELWRKTMVDGRTTSDKHLLTNFAPVLYPIDTNYIARHGFTVMDITKPLGEPAVGSELALLVD